MTCFIRITIILFFILFTGTVFAQVSGTIYYTDGSTVDIERFDELSLKLCYFSSVSPGKKNHESGEYEKILPLEKLNQITFMYDTGNAFHDFFYQLTVIGTTKNHDPFKTKIRTWDWMEISSAEKNAQSDIRIIFFYKEKQMKIDRIIFKSI